MAKSKKALQKIRNTKAAKNRAKSPKALQKIRNTKAANRKSNITKKDNAAAAEFNSSFSIDGKSFTYRDPKNLENAELGSRGDRGIRDDTKYNPDAYDYTDPLYQYSQGRVNDAARALGIGNVNSRKEVNQILGQIRNPQTNKPSQGNNTNKGNNTSSVKTNVSYANSLGDIPGNNYNFSDRNNKQIVPGISSPQAIAAAAKGGKGGGGKGGGGKGGGGNKGRNNRFKTFTTDFQAQLDAMFAGQAERDAERARKEEERLREFELGQRTMLGNSARSGQQATYQLGGTAGRMKGGTSGFKRRKGSTASRIMSGLSTNSGGTLNV